MVDANNFPVGWVDCPRLGEIVNDMFLPFKTPIDESYDYIIPLEQRFNLNEFLASKKTRDIGLIIDLSITDPYYKAVQLSGIKCYSRMNGTYEIPSFDEVNYFIQLADNFFELNPDAYIGVHCSLGYNSTGFMIVSYLFERCNMELDTAIHLFANARQPGIYKEKFLDELTARYKFDQLLEVPTRPSWLNENWDISEINVPEDPAELSTSESSTPINISDAETVYSSDHEIKETKEGLYKATIEKAMGYLLKSKEFRFPRSKPLAINHDNLNVIAQKPYLVTWKGDGTRSFLYIANEEFMCLINEDKDILPVQNIPFPWENNSHMINTIFDGELIMQVSKSTSTTHYYISDIMSLNGQYVGNKPFEKRLQIIDSIMMVRRKYVPREIRDKESIIIHRKRFWPIKNTREVWEGMSHQDLGYAMEALIFQPNDINDVYKLEESSSQLRWRPPEKYTIDFLLKISEVTDDNNMPRIDGKLFVAGKSEPFAVIEHIRESWQETYSGKIVEASFNFVTSQWEIIQERKQSGMATPYHAAMLTMKNIKNPVYIEDVYKIIKYSVKKKQNG